MAETVVTPGPERSPDDTQELPVITAAPLAEEESPLVLVPGTLAVEAIQPPPAPAEPVEVEVTVEAEAPPIAEAAQEAAPPAPDPEPAPPVAVRPPKPARRSKPPKPPRAPRPPKVRKPRRLPAWLTRRPSLRVNAIPVRVFATALVVALALFAIGTLRDDDPEDPQTTTAGPGDPVLATVPPQESASGQPSPSPSSPSPSSSKPKPKDTPTEEQPTEDDDPPGGGGGGKDPKTGSFRIKSVSSGLCLDEADLGDPTVVQKSCSSSPLSAEGLESLGGGDYYLTTDHPEHRKGCISSAANGVGNGFIGDACTGDAAQVFHLDEVADGVYRIRLVDNGTCIAVSGEGAPVSASCGSGKDQRFTFL